MGFEYLYDVTEQPLTRYFSFATDHTRYDFGILFSGQFEGKSMVICLQTLKAALLSLNDMELSNEWLTQLDIAPVDHEVLKRFFQSTLYSIDSLKTEC